jgi:hypothetical protein
LPTTEEITMNQQNESEGSMGGLSGKSHAAAEQLKGSLVDQAGQVRQRAESAKEQTAERIRRVAKQLRQVSETLAEDDNVAANVADRASRGIEGIARYVSDTDAQGFIRDTESLARRQPAIFFGGAFLLGLCAGRFMKSSRPEGSFDSQSRGGRGYRTEGDVGYREQSSGREERSREERPSGFVAQGNDPNQRRYQENYDAAFGRDAGEQRRPPPVPRPGTSLNTAPAATTSPRSFDPNKAPESNGSRQAGKGSA